MNNNKMLFNFNVNKVLLPVKLHYFLFNAGTGAIIPFMSVLAKKLGFSSVIVGIIYTISPFASMVSKPIMGGISDRFFCKKSIFLSSIILCGLAIFLLNFAPTVPTGQKIRFSCENTSSSIDTCVNNFIITDECVVDSIKSEIGHVPVNCQMTCEMDSPSWNTICSYWNLSNYCDSNSSTLTFTSSIESGSINLVGECIFFQIDSITLNGSNFVPYCPVNGGINSDCKINCNASTINELVTNPTIADGDIYGHYSFWVVMLIYVLIWVFHAVGVTNADSICFDLLEDEPHKYGNQRMWGSVGWGTNTLMSGALIDLVSSGSVTNYTASINLGLAVMIVNFVVAFFIKNEQKKGNKHVIRESSKLLLNIPCIVFAIWCIFMGMCTALIWNFLFWIVEELASEQGCDSSSRISTLQGLLQLTQCLLGEFPFFFLSGWIIKKLGHINCMTLTTFVFGVRFILYSVIKNPWWFIPIEISNGLTFGLFYSTMASYASIIAPLGTETTLQGAAGATFEGIGVSLGSLIAGILIEKFGGSVTFRIAGIVALVVSVVHAIIQWALRKFGFVVPLNTKNNTKQSSYPLEQIPTPTQNYI